MTFQIDQMTYRDYGEVLKKYNYRVIEIEDKEIPIALVDINSIEELIELQTELKKQPGKQWGIVIDDGTYPDYKEITIYDNYLG